MMDGDEAEKVVVTLAAHLGVAIAPEHLSEAAVAWRMMAPHLDRVMTVQLPVHAEPAALFRP